MMMMMIMILIIRSCMHDDDDDVKESAQNFNQSGSSDKGKTNWLSSIAQNLFNKVKI